MDKRIGDESFGVVRDDDRVPPDVEALAFLGGEAGRLGRQPTEDECQRAAGRAFKLGDELLRAAERRRAERTTKRAPGCHACPRDGDGA